MLVPNSERSCNSFLHILILCVLKTIQYIFSEEKNKANLYLFRFGGRDILLVHELSAGK